MKNKNEIEKVWKLKDRRDKLNKGIVSSIGCTSLVATILACNFTYSIPLTNECCFAMGILFGLTVILVFLAKMCFSESRRMKKLMGEGYVCGHRVYLKEDKP